MTPSHYQQAFYEALTGDDDDLQLQAVAGSGKTSSLQEGVNRLDWAVQCGTLMTAFNQHIKQELERRQIAGGIPDGVTISTIHGLGYQALRRAYQPQDARNWVDAKKYDRMNAWWWQRQGIHTGRGADPEAQLAAAAVPKLVRLAMLTLAEPEEADLLGLVNRYGIDLPESREARAFDAVADLLDWGRRGMAQPDLAGNTYHPQERIGFEDMIWLPLVEDIPLPQYDLIMVDEAQDLSRSQQELLLRTRADGGRMVWVGDPAQCQPPETLVTLTGGTQTPIYSIKTGDRVVSFSRDSGCFVGRTSQGRVVRRIAQRPFHGTMLMVAAAGKHTRCTPNHKWLVRFTDRVSRVCVTYLMRCGNRFRVGWCQLFTRNEGYGTLHLAQRSRNEKADATWILGVHGSRTAASIEESVIAARYGLPTATFEPVHGATHLTRESIDAIFDGIGDCQVQRAHNCLNDFGRLPEFPFYSLDVRKRQGRTTLFVTEACNLIPGLMSVPVFTGNKAATWAPISVTREEYDGPVYSLEIDGDAIYIADGLATHNSIYSFAGADSESFDRIRDLTDARRMPLSICYRCAKSIVARARELVPEIEPWERSPEGLVREDVTTMDLIDMACDAYAGSSRESLMILCRVNAPLVSAALWLIRRGVPAKVRGRDIGQQLEATLKQIERIEGFRFDLLEQSAWAYLARERNALSAREGGEMQIAALEDRVESVLAVWQAALKNGAHSLAGMRERIRDLFSDDERTVILSSIHKAKGLEADRVGILRGDLLPHPAARQLWQLEQEHNLQYVAVTRARRELMICPQ